MDGLDLALLANQNVHPQLVYVSGDELNVTGTTPIQLSCQILTFTININYSVLQGITGAQTLILPYQFSNGIQSIICNVNGYLCQANAQQILDDHNNLVQAITIQVLSSSGPVPFGTQVSGIAVVYGW